MRRPWTYLLIGVLTLLLIGRALHSRLATITRPVEPAGITTAALAGRVIPADPGITGVVVDATGAPMSQVMLCAVPVGHEDQRDHCERSDDSGRFEARGLPAGQYHLTVRVLRWIGSVEPYPELITVTAGTPAPEVRIALPPRHPLEGRVVDEQGHPVTGAVVSVMIPGTDIDGSFQRVGLDGHFAFEGLPAGKVSLSVDLPGMPHAEVVSPNAQPTIPVSHELTVVVRARPGP